MSFHRGWSVQRVTIYAEITLLAKQILTLIMLTCDTLYAPFCSYFLPHNKIFIQQNGTFSNYYNNWCDRIYTMSLKTIHFLLDLLRTFCTLKKPYYYFELKTIKDT